MKRQVKNILKDKGRLEIFTDSRYNTIYDLMKFSMKEDEWLKNYLSLDPLNKAQWMADHLIKLVDLHKI